MSECNVHPSEYGTLLYKEVNQLMTGAEQYNEKQERAMNSGSSPNRDQMRREEQALEKYA